MESHEVLRDAFKKASPKEIAAELGISLSLVYKWAQEQNVHGSGSRNPLDRINEIIRLTGHHEIIDWLCRQQDGYFVPNNEQGEGAKLEMLPATNEMLMQFSALMVRIGQAAEDQSITSDEAEEIRAQWNRLKGFTEGFVRGCEGGNFENMDQVHPPTATVEEHKEKPRTRLF